jgi:uncharacterized protein YdhG (YjbR/CyaY superfamily)
VVKTDPRVDAYLAARPDEQREVLQALRSHVAALVPEARETIAYGMPGFRLNDRLLLSYAGWKRHCSLYPIHEDVLAKYAIQLKGYGTTKGSLHFSRAQPLPDGLLDDLVRRLVANGTSSGG